MIEVRSFDGGYEQLAEFVARTWRQNYQGRMPVPHWTGDFFARDGGPEEVAMDWTGAAYDGTRLVGLLPGWPVTVLLHGREELVRTGTGASVDGEYQRKGVGKLLNQWAMDHAREHGCGVTLFYLYDRTGQFKGTKFWKARGMPTEFLCKLGQWVRPLDHAAEGIRAFRLEDLPACEAMVRQVGDSMDLARRFGAEELARHLDFKDVARTMVVEHEGRAAGLVNFVDLEILGRTVERFGLIDFVAFDSSLPHARQVDLLRAVLRQLKQDGLAAAFMLRGSNYAGRAMRGAGFLPVFPEYSLMGIKSREDISLENVRRVFHLWR
jgi:GNAT superfamily N-acetyltransferase/N-acetylglutamate synthase-like GNAT family acetyltransferase